MKWRAFHRSAAVGLQAEQAIHDIISRLPKQIHATQPLFHIQISRDWYPQRKLIARSLVEWLEQSGLSLTRCVPETSTQTQLRNRHHSTLEKVAEVMHTWFDPEIHDLDLPLLPLSYYVTDGSYTKPKQLLILIYLLLNTA